VFQEKHTVFSEEGTRKGCVDKIPERISLKRGNIYFGSEFQSFPSMVDWLCYSGPGMRHNIMVRMYGGAKRQREGLRVLVSLSRAHPQ
jgi:hypothetical protein